VRLLTKDRVKIAWLKALTVTVVNELCWAQCYAKNVRKEEAMKLTIRDGLNTIFALGTGGMLWANNHYETNAFWGSNRWTLSVIAVMGLLIYLFGIGFTDDEHAGLYAASMAILLLVGVSVFALGLSFASFSYVATLAGVVGALWFVSILRHLFAHGHVTTHTHAHNY